MKLIIIILLVALATQAYSQLQCYECDDCEELDTERETAITCGAFQTTTETETETSTDTSTNPTTDTEESTESSIDTETVTETSTPEISTETSTETLTDSSTTEYITLVEDNPDPGSDLKLMAQQQRNSPQAIPIIFRKRRQTSDPDYYCYKVEVAVGDNVQVNRGCVIYDFSDDVTCRSIDGQTPQRCNLCNENECNSSSTIVTSLVAIVASILITSRLL